MGVDIGGTKLLMLAEGQDLDAPLTRRLATGPSVGPAEIEAAIRAFLIDNALKPTALGIAVPGLVENGQVRISDVLPQLTGWTGIGIDGAPQLLVNDIRGALAQESAGLSKASSAAVIVCGTAVGSAYLCEGRVVRGSRGWAGEIGSMPIPTPQGVKRLDDLAGGGAIVRAVGAHPEQIHAALAAGDTRTQRIVNAAGETLGLAIASLVNILNPDVVRIAGGTLGFAGYWDTAVATAHTHALPELWDVCTVDRIQAAELVVARGAMRLAAAAIDDQAWVRQYV
ncbi:MULTISPECIES: ROK family protein [unclassified Streptomyces]|uniref:ROK family protein n=1 Tax=unclassified Streptomyces TaxID=2593676 RepID=UPI00202F7C46|nr:MULTISPECIES: ROK family protein [unclassified Streptomyces]MCM1973318.1 ROK family protein [Streptomyces sp. G1]MCX5124420.1 ROK family protein [Streptomyces sp. NBC_00347]MCX5297667.1 ROK family protein [Streptomyces sp. NBC_00193]